MFAQSRNMVTKQPKGHDVDRQCLMFLVTMLTLNVVLCMITREVFILMSEVRGVKFLKDMHKYHYHHDVIGYTNCTCTEILNIRQNELMSMAVY